MKFTEKDKQTTIEFVNFIAKQSKFDGMSVEDVITFFKLLNWVQTQLVPKIEANILEVIAVNQKDEEPENEAVDVST